MVLQYLRYCFFVWSVKLPWLCFLFLAKLSKVILQVEPTIILITLDPIWFSNGNSFCTFCFYLLDGAVGNALVDV